MKVHDGSGEVIEVKLHGNAEDVDIRLEKNHLHISPTYITLTSSSIVKIVNRSSILAHYKWKMFSTEEEENAHRSIEKELLDKHQKETIAKTSVKSKLNLGRIIHSYDRTSLQKFKEQN